MTHREQLRRLWKHVSPSRRRQFFVVAGLVVAAAAAEAFSIVSLLPFLAVFSGPDTLFSEPMLQPAIRLFGIESGRQLLYYATVVACSTALVSGALRLTLLWASTRLSFAIGADFSTSIYRRSLYQPYAVHVSRNSSDVVGGIASKANAVVSTTLQPLLNMLGGACVLVAVSVTLLIIDARVAIGSFVGFSLIYAPIITLANRRIATDSALYNREVSKVLKALNEGMGGIRDVLLDGTQEVYCRVYQNADTPLRRASANIIIIGASPRFAIEALGIVLLNVVAFSMAGRPNGISGAIPILGALGLGAQRLLPAMQQLYGNWSTIQGGKHILSDTLDLLEQPLPEYAESPAPAPMSFEHDIRLASVSFRYGPDLPDVLKGVNLVIPKGARLGIVGVTGSGKSTMLDIIMALLSPTDGQLLVDGIVITAKNLRSWQAQIAHVPQAIYLTDATITENIAFGVPPAEIDYDRVRESARQAQIADAIDQMPLGYSTMVGERGVRLSGGQRQRIGIARALYKRAEVIILDEATAALDGNTELAVMQAIEGIDANVTVLIVAHRITTLRNCTEIVSVEHGVIARRGSYDTMFVNP
jgi:ATP-binding cassette subfamily B protein